MGFPLLGLLLSALVLAPNLLLLGGGSGSAPPVRVTPVVAALERVGQAACLVVPAVTPVGPLTPPLLVAAGVLILAYDAGWVRFLVRGRRWPVLYGSWGRLPVPMAVMPVLAFLAAGLGLGNPWIVASGAVLAAGHIPTALAAAAGLRR